jgi:anti-anti-sigma factor
MTQVTSEDREGRLTLCISGRLDAAGAKVVAGALDRALAAGRHSVELDMGGVGYLSSAGMRVLIIYYRKFSQLHGRFYLTSVNDTVGRVLEMTGLYNLLEVSPDHEEETPPGQHTLPFEGWRLTVSEPEPGAFLYLDVTGPGTDPSGPRDESRPEILPFPAPVLAFGTGALGYGAADCAGRYGPFLAAGGFAACRPLQGDRDADYVEYAQTDIPGLYVLDATCLAGSYSCHGSFGSDATPPDLHELAKALLSAAGTTVAGFIIAAECERAEAGGPGQDGTDKNGKTNPAGDSSGTSSLCLMLAGGVAGGEDMQEIFRKRLFPDSAGTGFSCHAHAVFFPYRPLRRRGPVKLKDTLAFLFDQDMQDVVCPGSAGKGAGYNGVRLVRGLAWFAPLKEKREETR